MLTFRYLIVLKLFFPTITCTHTHTEFCWCNAEWLPPHDKVKLFITTVHKIGQLPIYIYFSPKRTECVHSDDVFWRIVNSIAKQNTLLNVCVCNVYIFIFIQRIAVQLCLCVWKNRMRSQRFPAKVIKHKTNLFIFQLEFSHLMISHAEAAASKAFAFYISFSYRSIFFSSSSLWLGWISLNSSQDDLMTQKNGTSTKKNYEYDCLLALFYFVANNLCVCVCSKFMTIFECPVNLILIHLWNFYSLLCDSFVRSYFLSSANGIFGLAMSQFHGAIYFWKYICAIAFSNCIRCLCP